MSYDLMAFAIDAAPEDRAGFDGWYRETTQWAGSRDWNSPEGTSPELAAFFDLIRADFPPLNGPHAASEDRIDDPEVTDYTIAEDAIYMCFRWSVAQKARNAVLDAAATARVGIYDLSARDGTVARTGDDLADLRRQPMRRL